MKKIFLLFGFALLLVISCKKDSSDGPGPIGPVGTDSELPYVVITTASDIENEPKVPGQLRIYQQDQEVFTSTIGIEYRGSTSFRLSDKKSYGFETWDDNNNDEAKSILGFPEEEDWILMGHVFRASEGIIFDPTLMRHHIGYELYRSMGNYASRSQFIELTVNGNFRGTYLLMEKLKRDNDRIDIARLEESDNDPEQITGGYILKIDKTSGADVAPNQPLSYYESNWDDDARYNETISFRSNYGVDGSTLDFEAFRPPYHAQQYLETYFLYEYPRADRITAQQKEYIQGYMESFETALLNDDLTSNERSYTDYIELSSFVDYFILNELVSNVDAYRISTYLFKDRGEKLHIGPVWDLNIGYNSQDRVPSNDWIANYNDYVPGDAWLVPFWWDRLLEDPVFINLLKQRWSSLRANVLATQRIEDLVRETSAYLVDNGAIERNYERWSGIEVDYANEIEAMINYLKNRLAWMDETIPNM
ncbi:CotH kinase family protein [Lewinella sp. LCG006]|uniref:CotH kinase family protein n=1 Tax=Lewinella sp. LCG006 TaxID=3231911 RepID=UPI00345FE2CA